MQRKPGKSIKKTQSFPEIWKNGCIHLEKNMATSKEYIEFVCEQIYRYGAVTYRKMFGEYMVYLQGRPVLLVCDNCAMVKKLPELAELMRGAAQVQVSAPEYAPF